jgi:PhnB protein
MTENPPKGYPRISPYLLYEDGYAAIDFITRAFGFTERMRMPGESEGQLGHAELELDGGVIMLGTPARDFKNPKRLGGATVLVHVYVDDVDAHYDRAKAAGAEITREPATQDYGDRNYSAKDPEGHDWFFSQHVEDVSMEEIGVTQPEHAAAG